MSAWTLLLKKQLPKKVCSEGVCNIIVPLQHENDNKMVFKKVGKHIGILHCFKQLHQNIPIDLK